MYVMRVILCLFSALNRRVDALQISLIIIITLYVSVDTSMHLSMHFFNIHVYMFAIYYFSFMIIVDSER